MPSPFGKNRSSDAYYQFAGLPRRNVYRWNGMPFPTEPGIVARAVAGVPDDLYTESVEQELGRHEQDAAEYQSQHHEQDLADFGYGSPSGGTKEYAGGPVGPGYPVAMSTETARRSVLSTFPDEMKMAYGQPRSLGFFGNLSDNEKRALQIGALAGAAYLAYRVFKK